MELSNNFYIRFNEQYDGVKCLFLCCCFRRVIFGESIYPFPAHIGAPQIKAHGPSIRSISACAYKRTDAVFFNSHFYKEKSGILANFKPFRDQKWVKGACASIRTEFSFEKLLFFNRFVYIRAGKG